MHSVLPCRPCRWPVPPPPTASLTASLPAACPAPSLIPVHPPRCSGHRLVDAAVFQPVPFRSAIADGCTHLLVLCTRPVHLTRASRVNTALADAMEEGIKRAVLSPDYMRPAWQVGREGQGAGAEGAGPEGAARALACCCGVAARLAAGASRLAATKRRHSPSLRCLLLLLPSFSSTLLQQQAEVDYLHKDGLSQDDMLLKVG